MLTPLITTLIWLTAAQDVSVSNAPITLETLLKEILDRENIAQIPDPPYTCRQFSSYDRESVSPDQPGWFANMDRSHFLAQESHEGKTEYLMMDADGPGAIVRMWATWHGAKDHEFSDGTLKIYLDKNPIPTISGPISSILGGDGFVGSPLSRYASLECDENVRAYNLFMPIPYESHCRVTYETDAPIDPGARTGEALYYQINYRTYSDDVLVESYSQEVRARAAMQVEKTRRVLAADQRPSRSEKLRRSYHGRLGEGASAVIRESGNRAIQQIRLRLKSDDDIEQALRSTILELTFDGSTTVWCPVDHFFGCGTNFPPFFTWYTDARTNGTLTAHWIMPFKRDVIVRLHNIGKSTITVSELDVDFTYWDWDDRSMYFHTTWKPQIFLETRQGKEGYFDANFLEVEGEGVLVGDTLSVFNGAAAWWGEGDEKIYVDGESFPSHFGTGTEDYYGYAWCRPEFFCAPFHAQPNGSGNFNPGFSINSRYRCLDAIPFKTSLKFDMEVWHWADTKIHFMPAVFWYARPESTHNVIMRYDAAAMPLARKRSDIVDVFKRPGAIEGEELKQVSHKGGVLEAQEIHGLGWSGDQQIWWKDASVGDVIAFAFDVEKTGHYKVYVSLTKANDYGEVELRIGDEKPIVFDRYHPSLGFDELPLGDFVFEKGAQTLEVTIKGSHPDAIKRHMFGMDYLRLEASD